ncbi:MULTISPECIES: GAF and ANTAR domain-containing protein [unclassified Nocardia]|uniref:GAF and ANTAR domain-containing protein n=1 Tax=unclassified Nocardia TaxID=2637762 RepID=UPI0024A977B7|nr:MULTISPECIES: GAF and ANTAR domain-containing protein [unclassified Nocardia]
MRYESQAALRPESMRPFRLRMATLHRQTEARQRACARLYHLYILRLLRWRAGGQPAQRPVFMAVVADQLHMDSAAVVIFDDKRHELLTAVSDDTARAAHEAESVLGDGPTLDIAAGTDRVLATGAEVTRSWPQFGRVADDLGIHTVLAVPLRVVSRRLGALCGYSRRSSTNDDALTRAARVADTLSSTVLLAEQNDSNELVLRGTLFDDADYPSIVNQATGVVAAQHGHDLDTALALLRARAFAEGVSLSELAHRVLERCRSR